MSKNKKRKRRERDEIVGDESENGDRSSTDGRHTWNTDDLYFDRNGRLVVKNAKLARAIARAVNDQGGITVHVAYPGDSMALAVPRFPPKPMPPFPPLPPETDCPDMICGLDLNLVVVRRPMQDPPRDRTWEQIQDV